MTSVSEKSDTALCKAERGNQPGAYIGGNEGCEVHQRHNFGGEVDRGSVYHLLDDGADRDSASRSLPPLSRNIDVMFNRVPHLQDLSRRKN